MFIKLELWDEQPPIGGALPLFGVSADAYVNTRASNPRYLPINLASLMSFESIEVTAVGRPGSSENRADPLRGVRVLLADGSRYIVFDDKDPVFARGLAAARQAEELVYDYGASRFMREHGLPVIR